MPVACAFLGAIFTNIKTLQYANVETFIVFRSSTPLFVSVADYLFLGRELPSSRSWMSLVGLLIGSIIYVQTDSHFHVSGYYWVCVWYMVFCFDQVRGVLPCHYCPSSVALTELTPHPVRRFTSNTPWKQ